MVCDLYINDLAFFISMAGCNLESKGQDYNFGATKMGEHILDLPTNPGWNRGKWRFRLGFFLFTRHRIHRSLGETRRHGGSFLIKRWYSVLCHFLQSKSHFSVLEIKWVSLTQVPSYLESFMCPGEQWSSYSSFAHCSWYQWSSVKCCLMLRVFSRSSYNMSQQFDPFLLQHLAEWTYGVFSISSWFARFMYVVSLGWDSLLKM